MKTDAFDYAIDAIERTDYVGTSGWAQRKREAIQRIAYAKRISLQDIARARTRGILIASFSIICAEAALILLIYYSRHGF